MRQPGRGWTRALLVLWFFLLTSALAAVAEASRLDRYLERKMKQARIPGMAVALVVDGELAWTKGYGWADVENRVPATPDTLFLLGSVSKLVTATGVMRLHDRKGLDLDDDVNDYLPFELRNPAFPDQPITLRHLLTHTSSISDQHMYRELLDEFETFGDWPGTLTEVLTDYLIPGGRYYVAGNWLDSPPGARASYSNLAFSLLAVVAEHVTGRSFEDFQQQAIFGPLEMTESSWFLRDLDLDHVAVPYAWEAGRFVPFPHWGVAFYPAGQLRTSARQLANFALLHLNGGSFGRRRILRPGTAEEMTRVQFPDVDPQRGLAFYVREDGDDYFIYHTGGFHGCTTDFLLELNGKLGVIVLTNGEPHQLPGAGARRAVRAFFQMGARLFEEARRMAGGE